MSMRVSVIITRDIHLWIDPYESVPRSTGSRGDDRLLNGWQVSTRGTCLMTNAAMSVAVPAATKPRTRVNWTPAERSEWLALFEKSGQSVSEFCRANDLPPATLSLWRQGQAGTSAGAEGGELVEISSAALLGAAGARAAVTIRLPGGIVLEITADADPVWLGALVKNLNSARA
jgi:transposase-like protein